MVNKSKSAFRTIAEVAEEIDVATHVLRFWETKFPQISPMKTSGGRRYYRPDDVELIKVIKTLLYDKRYTIEGVQKVFSNKSLKAILGGEIQKDFFEIKGPEVEPLEPATLEQIEVFKLSEEQKKTLLAASDELKTLEEKLKSVLS